MSSDSSTTGHFPGAPINTEPVTTMATSTSEPMTSSSSAAVPPASQPASESAAPATEDSAATKEATKEAPKAADAPAADTSEKESTDPATTSAATTGTTTTTTTTTSSTSTTATTTTTTTTTTTATGKITPPISNDTLFHETIKRCNNCLFLIRKLRTRQDHIAEAFLGCERDENCYQAFCDYIDLGTIMQEVMNIYEKLEQTARRLPPAIPPIDNINVMRTLYSQEHTMCHTDINTLLERMIDAGNWNEGQFQMFHYLAELLRVHGPKQTKPAKPPGVLPNPIPSLNSKLPTTANGHAAFHKAYDNMKTEIENKSLGIYPKILHRTGSGFVVEFLFGCGGTNVETDNDIVHTMKFLLVENCGTIEYINMFAPTEEWKYTNNYGGSHVDPFAPSSFNVYRRLTRQANIHLVNCFGSHASRWTSTTLLQFISLFGKFRDVFNVRCRVCKRYTKNALPPLLFDIRNVNNASHEGCR